MGVIDFRFRPVGTQSITRELTYEYLRKMRLQPAQSFVKQSVELMFQEMDQANIEMAVIGVPAPTDKPGFASSSNEQIRKYIIKYPKRFLGLASLDISSPESCLDGIDRAKDDGMIGVTVEPSTARVPMRFDDRRLYPIYEKLQKNGTLLVTVMSALLGPYMDDCKPEWVDHVATDFPEMRIIIQHGGWPYSREAVGVAFKQPNVFLVPGQYMHYEFPGSEDYIRGLNRQLSEQILFGSVYPNCGPLSEVIDIIDNLGIADSEKKEKYLEGNAKRILGLTF